MAAGAAAGLQALSTISVQTSQVAYAIGMMIGPLIGSIGVECFGVRTTFIAVGLGYGAYAWLISRVPRT